MRDKTPPAPDLTIPLHRYTAVVSILRDREHELLELKGSCSAIDCRLHYAHTGPCDIDPPGEQKASRP